jgi:hypothetical protein
MPSTYQIVTVLPRNGGSTAAAAPAPARAKVAFTDKDRDIVRKHVKTRTVERQTTGSTAKVEIRRGERLPDSVEVEEFPETVYPKRRRCANTATSNAKTAPTWSIPASAA